MVAVLNFGLLVIPAAMGRRVGKNQVWSLGRHLGWREAFESFQPLGEDKDRVFGSCAPTPTPPPSSQHQASLGEASGSI